MKSQCHRMSRKEIQGTLRIAMRPSLPPRIRAGLRALLAVGLCAWLAAAQRPASAQPPDPTAKVTQLNREALAAIEKREYEKAREILKRALDLCETSGLAEHPIAARTHLHMGVVIIDGFKNPELGRKQFARALAIEPGITLTDSLSTPELEDTFAEVRVESRRGGAAPPASAGGGEETPSARPAAPAESPAQSPDGAGRPAVSSSGLSYHTLSEVKQGASIVVTVAVEETLKLRRLVLAYRPQGSRDFLGREMEPVGNGSYRAEIPETATTGPSVAYYIEAQDDEGQPLAQRGSEERPLVVSFADQARPSSARVEAVAERKEVRRRRDEDEDAGSEGHTFASLLVGTGFGYVSGMGEVNADTPVTGTVSGALIGHIAPELGYWLGPDLSLSLQGRFQLVTGPTEIDVAGHTYNPVRAALAVFAKASWWMGAGHFRPFVSAGLGGGQIRHVVTFANLKDCGAARNQTCVDSVAAGPLLAEAGAGLLYKLTADLGLVLSSNAEVAAPHFTVNLDINAGVEFEF